MQSFPAPWKDRNVLDALLVIVTAVHLLAVNVSASGPFVGLWLQARERRGDAAAGAAGRLLAWWSLGALAVGIFLGLAALGLLWIGHRGPYFDAWSLIPASRYWFGIAELAFYAACVAWHLALWKPEAPKWYARFGWWLLPILAGTNLMYHFPTLFAVIATLSTRPELGGPDFKFTAAILEPEALARSLHHLLASVSVTGVVLMGLRPRIEARAGNAAGANRIAVAGARMALATSALQLVAGVFLLMALPTTSREALLGQDLTSAGLFVVSLAATFVLLHLLAASSIGKVDPRTARRAMLAMFVVVLSMSAVRHHARAGIFRTLSSRSDRASPP